MEKSLTLFEPLENDNLKNFNNIILNLNEIYKEKNKDKYYESSLLLFSLTEELIYIIVYTKIILKYAPSNMSKTKFDGFINKYTKNHSFDNLIRLSLIGRWISTKCYSELDTFRNNRNKFIHEFSSNKNKFTFEDFFNLSIDIFDEIIPIINEDFITLFGDGFDVV